MFFSKNNTLCDISQRQCLLTVKYNVTRVQIGLVLATGGCLLTASAKPSTSYSYAYRSGDQEECEEDAGAYKTVIAAAVPAPTVAYKSNPYAAGFYSQIDHAVMPAPILRTAQPAVVPVAPAFATVTMATPQLEPKIAAEPLIRINRPEAAMSTQWINRIDSGPALLKAPVETVARTGPVEYIAPAPVMPAVEIEQGRVLSVAPIMETKMAAKPLYQTNGLAAVSAQWMNRIDSASAWKTRVESAPAPILRADDCEQIAPIQYAAPILATAAPPMLEAKIAAEPLYRVNRPLIKQTFSSPPAMRLEPLATAAPMAKYIDIPTAFKAAPKMQYASMAPKMQYVSTAPLIETKIASTVLHPSPAPIRNLAPSMAAYSYGQPMSSYYQTYGISSLPSTKLAIEPQYLPAAALDTVAEEPCEK